jgi:Ca2+-binding EF-hand superfamily protein
VRDTLIGTHARARLSVVRLTGACAPRFREQADDISAWAERVSARTSDEEDADLPDILGAFEACDIDGSNTISASELHAVLVAIGAEITMSEVKELIAKVKAEEDEISESSEEDSVTAIATGGSQYTMDERGLHMRRKKLAHRKHRSKLHSQARYGARDHAPITLGYHSNPDVRKQKLQDQHDQRQRELEVLVEEDVNVRKEIQTLEHELELEDFVLLVRGKRLQRYFDASDSDWRARVGEIRGLRRAYDIADVDGDNCMQRDELETVRIITRKRVFLTPFIYRCDLFTKTGSEQT